jgi:hypothetical protein
MEAVLDNMPGYEYKWLENDFLQVISKTSGQIEYGPDVGEIYQLNQLIASSGHYWDEFDQFNKLPHKERPYCSYWGNGQELSYEEEKDILECHRRFQLAIPYEEGDIFLLDNIKFCHGRTPFTGGTTRKIGVLLGDRLNRFKH